MGAAVEVFGLRRGTARSSPTPTPRATSLSADCCPATYDLRVSAPSFLPTLREDVALAAGASKVLNITLNTLFEAVACCRRGSVATTKTTVGSGRCALRPTVPSCASTTTPPWWSRRRRQKEPLTGDVAFMAGGSSEGYGSAVRHGHGLQCRAIHLLSTGTLGIARQLWATAAELPTACCAPPTASGLRTTVGTSRWRLLSGASRPADMVSHGGAAGTSACPIPTAFPSAICWTFNVGGEAQAIQFLGRDNAFRPTAR